MPGSVQSSLTGLRHVLLAHVQAKDQFWACSEKSGLFNAAVFAILAATLCGNVQVHTNCC